MYQWYTSIGQNSTNLPPGLNYGSMMRVVRCGTYLLQVVYNSTNVWYRRGATDNGFQQGWKQFANQDYVEDHVHGFFLYYDTADPDAPVSCQDTLQQAYDKVRAIIDGLGEPSHSLGGILQFYCNANTTNSFNLSLPNTESAIVTIYMSHSHERAAVEWRSLQSNSAKRARIINGTITDWF